MSKIYFVQLKEEFRNNFYYFCNGKKQQVDGMNDSKPFYHCITVNTNLHCAPVPGNDTVVVQLDTDKVEGLVEINDYFIGELVENSPEFKKFSYVLSVLKRNL